MDANGQERSQLAAFKPLIITTILVDLATALGCFLGAVVQSTLTLSDYITKEVDQYEFTTSTFDVFCIALARFLLLSLVYVFVLSRAQFSRASVVGAEIGQSQAAANKRAGSLVFAQSLALLIAGASDVFGCVKLGFAVSNGVSQLVGDPVVGVALISVSIAIPLLEVILISVGFSAIRRLHQKSISQAYLQINDEEATPLTEEEKKKKEDKAKLDKATVGRLAKMAKPEVWLMVWGTVMLLASSAANLVIPGIFGRVIDAVSTRKSQSELAENIVILIVVFILGSITSAIRSWIFTLAGQRVVARLRKEIFAAVMRQEIAFFDETRTGELTNRLSSDTAVLQNAVTVNFSMLARYLVQIIGTLVIMFILSWSLTLVILSVVPIVAIGAVIYGRFFKKLQKQFQDELGKAASTAEEAISNARTVRSFSNEARSCKDYDADIESSYQLGSKMAVATGGFAGVIGLIAQLAIGLVLWYGAEQVLHEKITTGLLTSFMIYTLTMAMAFAFLSALYGDFMAAVGASVRIFELLDRQPKINTTGGDIIDDFKGSIEFDNVLFRYPSRPDTDVLSGITFNVAVGSVCALVGPSGGGKSTVLSLIQRFYDPISGTVRLDGKNVASLDPQWAHRAIAMVSQEPVLFACSIAENIAYGRPNATQAEIEQASRQANAHEFISGFEKGYQTLVGERGIRLSGGQKQRVAIARALLMNPRILLLDEATSALDAESEHLVQEAIDRAMVGRTVVIIAHRLSTVRNASVVIVIEKGAIAETGTHESLFAKQGAYYKLVQRQMLGRANIEADSSEA